MLSRLTSRQQDNNAFFRGNRQSPWWAVAFGMVGASISGVTFVSVPGMVTASSMTYLQTCLGFVLGYATVAFVLLPIYYRLNVTSIYTYLEQRFDPVSHRTGASFFLLSKLVGASLRLYLVCLILHRFAGLGSGLFTFACTAALVLLLIWLYTRQSGIRTIVWSDCLQTLVLLLALVLIIVQVCQQLHFDVPTAISAIRKSEMSRVFVFDDPASRQYFWKQFLSGIFIVVVMTGLDQDMMQKNLTCRTLRQSQLNMTVNGLLYFPVNLLFLALGVLLCIFVQSRSESFPAVADELLPGLVADGALGSASRIFFLLGIIAASFSSADSAMTSLTTSFCVDIMRRPDDERLRRIVHPLVALSIFAVILGIRFIGSSSVIDAVYVVCSYTYGPLLGLFSFGLFTRRRPRPAWVPLLCIVSPVVCYLIDVVVRNWLGYRFGYEMLMFNGLLTFSLLLLASAKFGADDSRGDGHVQTFSGGSAVREVGNQ